MTTIPTLPNGTPVTDETLFVGRDVSSGIDRRYSGAQLRDYVTAARVLVISGTSITITAAHHGRLLWFSADDPVTVTVGALIPDFQCALVQGGEGQVAVVASGPAPLVSEGDLFGTAAQYAPVSLVSIPDLGWWLGGHRAELTGP